MRAVGFYQFGGPEVLEVVELPAPEAGPGEVRIRVAAAALDPTDTGMRSGGRAAALAALTPPFVPGMELAGVVDAVGPGASWRVGDRVMAIVLPMRTGRGAQAEFVVVPSESVARVPEGVSLEAAATLPMNGLTARRALDLLALKPGQWLAVTGAAGAVGGYCIQLGVAEGLRTLAVVAAKDEAIARQLGAEVVAIVPRGGDVGQGVRRAVPDGVHGLVDAAVIGGPVLAAVRDGGNVAAVRAFEGQPERGISIHHVMVSDYGRNHEALERLGQLVSAGKLTLRVSETFPPERAAEAHQKFQAGGVRGRLVFVF